jgi:hypothetical protein
MMLHRLYNNTYPIFYAGTQLICSVVKVPLRGMFSAGEQLVYEHTYRSTNSRRSYYTLLAFCNSGHKLVLQLRSVWLLRFPWGECLKAGKQLVYEQTYRIRLLSTNSENNYTLLAICNSGHIGYLFLLWVQESSLWIHSWRRRTAILSTRVLVKHHQGVLFHERDIANLLYHNTALHKKRCIGQFHCLNMTGSPSTQFWIRTLRMFENRRLSWGIRCRSIHHTAFLHYSRYTIPLFVQVHSQGHGLRQTPLSSLVH